MYRVWSVLGAFSCLFLPSVSFAADPVVFFGLTNTPLGQATVFTNEFYYSVENVGSNGQDGVSLELGEASSGIYFRPYVSYPQDGNYMVAHAYGRLNGTNSLPLSRVKGGRASQSIYPIEADLSALAPESVTFEVSHQGGSVQRFPAVSAMVQIGYYGYDPGARVNPLTRLPDGSVGILIEFSSAIPIVFPTLLTSAYGDRLFIRANNPSNHLEYVSRVDVFAGGGVYGFQFYDVGLGIFNRPHIAVGPVIFNAADGRLQLWNLQNAVEYGSTYNYPGLNVDLKAAEAFRFEFVPFALTESNAYFRFGGAGVSGLQEYAFLGPASLWNKGESIQIALEEQSLPADEFHIQLRSSGTNVADFTGAYQPGVSVPTNTQVSSIRLETKTALEAASLSVRFAEAVDITHTNGVHHGDEVRFVMPRHFRFQSLANASLLARGLSPLTITNETLTDLPGSPAIGITRDPGNLVTLTWPDPNQLYVLEESLFYSPSAYYFRESPNSTVFRDPVVSVVAPVISTNTVQFFRLRYSPLENPQ